MWLKPILFSFLASWPVSNAPSPRVRPKGGTAACSTFWDVPNCMFVNTVCNDCRLFEIDGLLARQTSSRFDRCGSVLL